MYDLVLEVAVLVVRIILPLIKFGHFICIQVDVSDRCHFVVYVITMSIVRYAVHVCTLFPSS